MLLKRMSGALLVLLYACSSGTAGGGGGGPGGGASCKVACDHLTQAGCGTPDCEQSCSESRTQFAQMYPACTSSYDSYLSCMASAPIDCSSGPSGACSTQIQAFSDCVNCGPATGPQPGTACMAADEGKEICWGCKAVLDCRYGDGVFLWRVKEDCSANDEQCNIDEYDNMPYCTYGI